MLLVEQVVTPGPRWDKHGREGAGRGADPQLPNKEEVTGFWDNLLGFNYNRANFKYDQVRADVVQSHFQM